MTVLKRASIACLVIGLFLARDAAPARTDAAPGQAQPASGGVPLTMPNKEDSFKFAVLGDFGTGSRSQS